MKTFALLLLLVGCGSQKSSSQTTKTAAGDVAVVTSDYKSTSVELLNLASRTVTNSKCITSGTKLGTLSPALSGDVVLPSQTQANHELVLIDRANGALTYVDPNTCTARTQVSVASGFYGNPHDVASLSAIKSYVTRYNKNHSPTGTYDHGNDVLIINPKSGNITGVIDLSTYASNSNIMARPDRIWAQGTTAYVSLGQVSEDFMTTGTASLVTINTQTDQVMGTISLSPWMGCSQIVGDTNGIVIVCGGDSNNPNNLSASAVAFLSLAGTASGTLTAAAAGGNPIDSMLIANLGNGGYLAGTEGTFSGVNDGLWAYNTGTQQATHLGDSPGAYELGSAIYDPNTHTAMVTEGDTTTPRVRVFNVASGVPTETTSISVGADTGLPPRSIAAL